MQSYGIIHSTREILVYICDMGKRFYKPPRMVDYLTFSSQFLFRRFFVFMDPKIALEIFGYFGTALVILSFFMRDLKWLRAINMAGGLVSLIYALCVNTMPVVVLNTVLITINAFQLVRDIIRDRKSFKAVNNNDSDAYDEKEKNREENI